MRDAIGQLVELTGRVALAGGDGLLAPVGLGNTPTLTAADLDVPAEDAGESHLERGDARLLLEPRLELDHALGAALAQLAELRQLRVEFRLEDLAVFGLNRRTRDQARARAARLGRSRCRAPPEGTPSVSRSPGRRRSTGR